MLRILHFMQRDPDRELVRWAMEGQGIKGEYKCAETTKDFVTMLADTPLDLVFFDNGGTDLGGGDAVALVRRMQPQAVFVFLVGNDEATAKRGAMADADAIVVKDDLSELCETIQRVFERKVGGKKPGPA